MKRLVVTADDFGLTPGVTDGILEAHRNGIVTRTSIIAAGRAFEYAAEQARAHPRLGLGLHFTLVEERSVSDPGVVLPTSYRGVVLGRMRPFFIETELRAQIRKCTDAGLTLTHIDSHQHVHALPSILRIVLRVAEEHGIRRIRLPLDSPSLRHPAKTALCWLARYGAFRHPGGFVCDHMAGLFESGSLNEERLMRILNSLGEGTTELVCHPGKEDAACREHYAHWNYHWEEELAALTSPAVRERLRANSIVLDQV
jgi:chitin disaccharide deacetylase